MQRVSLLATLALACAFTACKKDSEKPKTKSTAELLTAKTWKITAKTQQAGSAAPTDEFAAYGTCYQDNTYKFEAGNKFTADEGAAKCLPVQTYSGGWGLSGNDNKTLTVLALDQPSGFSVSFHGTIEEISDSKFVLAESESMGNTTVVNKTTFTAQ